MKDQVKKKASTLISQESLESWLNDQFFSRVVVAPRWVDGVLLYRTVTGSREIAWDTLEYSKPGTPKKPLLSVKEIFFPPTEQLMTINNSGSEVIISEIKPQDKVLAFGIHPCDGQGVNILDALFLENAPIDEYYRIRRENTILAGFTCQEMGPNCFCTSVGGSLDDPSGMDILFSATQNGYVVTAGTEKGHQLILEAGWEESAVGDENHATQEISPLPGKEKWQSGFKDILWEKLGERCLSCRLCSYVCPTCRCFDVRDEALPDGGYERIRCWDACTGANYRRMGGGHRSRVENSERIRNRFYCKFYYYPAQYHLADPAACTGCGRCIEVCPVGVDILEVLGEMGAKV